jgi:flagellar protein FlgJ
VNVPTLEFEEGVAVRKVERFRAYESPADSFRDYAALIGRNSRYASARGTGENVEAFAVALQQGGYATDPNYAQKISAVASEVRARSDAMRADALKLAAAGPSTTNRVMNDG